MEDLLALLPSRFLPVLKPNDLTEIVFDIGRPMEIRYGKSKIWANACGLVCETDVKEVLDKLGIFGPDNRAAMPNALHRISRIVNRDGRVTGLTLRAGRPIPGCASVIFDLLSDGHSILLLGAPGVGKTSKLRDAAYHAANVLNKSVVVVDTSNEIAGDGIVPHESLGYARRLQVPLNRSQYDVMKEAVENHTPDLLIIDEIGDLQEAQGCLTFAQRGVQLLATAHGRTLEDLVDNPELNIVIGKIEDSTIGDALMIERGLTSKSVRSRVNTPAFNVVVELVDYSTVIVHKDVQGHVDAILKGLPVFAETRRQVGNKWHASTPKAPAVETTPLLAQEDDEPVPTKRERINFHKKQQERTTFTRRKKGRRH